MHNFLFFFHKIRLLVFQRQGRLMLGSRRLGHVYWWHYSCLPLSVPRTCCQRQPATNSSHSHIPSSEIVCSCVQTPILLQALFLTTFGTYLKKPIFLDFFSFFLGFKIIESYLEGFSKLLLNLKKPMGLLKGSLSPADTSRVGCWPMKVTHKPRLL